jgi:hypothetical protein
VTRPAPPRDRLTAELRDRTVSAYSRFERSARSSGLERVSGRTGGFARIRSCRAKPRSACFRHPHAHRDRFHLASAGTVALDANGTRCRLRVGLSRSANTPPGSIPRWPNHPSCVSRRPGRSRAAVMQQCRVDRVRPYRHGRTGSVVCYRRDIDKLRWLAESHRATVHTNAGATRFDWTSHSRNLRDEVAGVTDDQSVRDGADQRSVSPSVRSNPVRLGASPG